MGSDVSVTLPTHPVLPKHIPVPTTRVTRITDGVALTPGPIDADALVVDPKTFPQVAFWDGSFAGKPLETLMRDISTPAGSALPVIAVGAVPEGSTLEMAGTPIAMRVVATAGAFPGEVSDSPMVVADSDALTRALENAGSSVAKVGGRQELWALGPSAAVAGRLRRAGVPIEQVVTADQVRQTPSFLSLSWTFGFLQALGIMSGAIALAGILLYLQARQRSREVSYALARRMGLIRRSHRWSVIIELGTMLVASFLIGTVAATAASFLIYGRLDLQPGIPPPPLLRIPGILLGLVLAGLVVFAYAGAWLVQRRADRMNVAEVMRLAG